MAESLRKKEIMVYVELAVAIQLFLTIVMNLVFKPKPRNLKHNLLS